MDYFHRKVKENLSRLPGFGRSIGQPAWYIVHPQKHLVFTGFIIADVIKNSVDLSMRLPVQDNSRSGLTRPLRE